MDDLIEALTIMARYGSPKNPTNCGHDVLAVLVDPKLVPEPDLQKLERLGFFPDEDGNPAFCSFRFGSA